MAGLVGIISRTKPEDNRAQIQRMVQTIRHESFYSCGSFDHEGTGIYLGWATYPGGYADCMPVWNAARNCVLFLHGEVHPSREQLNSLEDPELRRGGGDARLLMRLYEAQGEAFLRSLNGCFHGLLVDLRRNTAVMFNDRLAMQRVYYTETRDAFLFASEAKALLAVRPELRSLDQQSVGEFMVCGCALENRTLFQNVFTLKGGSSWHFSDGVLKERGAYFTPAEWEEQELLPREEAYEGVIDVVRDAITRHTTSRLPVGISLSGGLDTRLIMAYLDRTQAGMPCYTFNGMNRESYDVKIARRVAASRGMRHHVLSLDQEFLKNFPALSQRVVYLSDGGLGAEGAYELLFNQMARKHADVRVTGNYGSEVFRRVRQLGAFRPAERMINADFLPQVDRAMSTFQTCSGGHDLSFSVFKQAPWFGYGRMAVEQSQVIVRNPFLDHEFLKYMYRVPQAIRDTSDLELHTIYRGDPRMVDIPTDRAERGRYGKMSSPFAHAWTWFIFKADYCYKSGMPQWLEQMHYCIRPLRPEKLVIGRHRFQYYRPWFRDSLATHIKDVLLDPKTKSRPYCNAAYIEEIVTRHIKGDRNYTDQIEKILSLELIQRVLCEANY